MSELRTGGQLFIVDNSDADWKVRSYLSDWCTLSRAIDIATGYFEIGALLALDGKWQGVDRIRILMGDEVSLRTKNAFVAGLAKITDQLDGSVEAEKIQNDFLQGVPAIVEAIRSGRIACRVYRKDKFHAKAYLTHARAAVVGSFGLVGSSNFTFPGLVENIELNVQIRGPEVGLLQEWYERFWQEAEDVTPDILRTLERHVRDYTPFEVYAKALHQLFTRHELTANEWEKSCSALHPILDQYQRDGYRALIGIARQHGGALLCDGVGLGKTFVGLMLIERLVMFEKKRVVLLVPKSGRESVWERNIRRYLPQLLNGFLSFKVYNHTDLMRGVSADGRDFPDEFRQLKSQADAMRSRAFKIRYTVEKDAKKRPFTETIRLMAEIDQIIAKHGGWPGAFAGANTAPPAKAAPPRDEALAFAAEDPAPYAAPRQPDLGLRTEDELPLG